MPTDCVFQSSCSAISALQKRLFGVAEKALSRCRTCFPACRKRLSCMLKGAFLCRKSLTRTEPEAKNRCTEAFPTCHDSVFGGWCYLFCGKIMSYFFTCIMNKYSSPERCCRVLEIAYAERMVKNIMCYIHRFFMQKTDRWIIKFPRDDR